MRKIIMATTRRRIAAVVGAALLVLGLAFLVYRSRLAPPALPPNAASLDLSRLPADTRLVARVDLEKPAMAKIFKTFIERAIDRQKSGEQRLPASCVNEVFPRIRSLLLSSSQTFDEAKNDHAVVVHGRFERPSLERCVTEVTRPHGSTRQIGKHTFYPGAGEKWIAIASPETVVYGTLGRVRQVVATFDGELPALSAGSVPELAQWERAFKGQSIVIGSLVPKGYAARRYAEFTVFATLLDVKAVLVTGDLGDQGLVLQAYLQAEDPARAQDVRASLALLVKKMFKRGSDADPVAQARGTNVEATVALTKPQTDALLARFKL